MQTQSSSFDSISDTHRVWILAYKSLNIPKRLCLLTYQDENGDDCLYLKENRIVIFSPIGSIHKLLGEPLPQPIEPWLRAVEPLPFKPYHEIHVEKAIEIIALNKAMGKPWGIIVDFINLCRDLAYQTGDEGLKSATETKQLEAAWYGWYDNFLWKRDENSAPLPALSKELILDLKHLEGLFESRLILHKRS